MCAVGFGRLFLIVLFAKLTIKSSHLTDSEGSVVELDQFVLCCALPKDFCFCCLCNYIIL